MRLLLRILAWTAAVGLLLPLIAAVGGLPVYVHPQIDPLRPADAVLVLGGPGYDRYPYGLAIAEVGWAPNVVFSDPTGAMNCTRSLEKVELYCFVPDPTTTRGEARGFAKLAAEHGWHSVIVVTFRPHISRARFIIQRCFDGQVTMIDSPMEIPRDRWPSEFLYQTAGYVRALLNPGC